MLKKILALVAMLYAAACFAAVDVNKATAAELDGIKGIGPGISTKILDERKKGNFKDWTDLVERVKGVGEGNAAKFSAEGMTVNGATFKGVAAAPAAAKKDEKKADAKAAAPAAAAAPVVAPAAATAKVDAKAEAKAKAAADKEAAKKAKADEKAAKAEEAKKATEAKAAAKADKAKPAASAASAAKK
jgi:competence protein ComEA